MEKLQHVSSVQKSPQTVRLFVFVCELLDNIHLDDQYWPFTDAASQPFKYEERTGIIFLMSVEEPV